MPFRHLPYPLLVQFELCNRVSLRVTSSARTQSDLAGDTLTKVH